MVEQAGHPRNLELSQTDLGKRFGVSQRQISKDFQRLAEYEAAQVGHDAVATTEFVCRKAVRELLAAEEFEKAARLQLEYFDWLLDTGVEERAPARSEVDARVSNEDESEGYVIISDDEVDVDLDDIDGVGDGWTPLGPDDFDLDDDTEK